MRILDRLFGQSEEGKEKTADQIKIEYNTKESYWEVSVYGNGQLKEIYIASRVELLNTIKVSSSWDFISNKRIILTAPPEGKYYVNKPGVGVVNIYYKERE